MTEARCDKCKHWASQDGFDWEAHAVGFGWCKAVRERWVIADEATAERIDGKAARQEALKASRAYVQDGSEYRAELITGPDFFCALFENQP
jgi:hypothetical protein